MASHISHPLFPKHELHVTASFKRRVRAWCAGIFRRLYEMGESIAHDDLPVFANVPRDIRIELPRRISGAEHMHVGNGVRIGPGSLLVAQTVYPSATMQHPERPFPVQNFEPTVVIGNRVTATGNLTIDAMQKVIIEDDVMFASNVIVMDGLHGFQTADVPYKYQPMWRIAPVVIGRGCWIAQNVVIMPGVTIGEMAVIGANSVVTHSIPPRCIAFGAPARVVKRWNEKDRCWVAASQEEAFVPGRVLGTAEAVTIGTGD